MRKPIFIVGLHRTGSTLWHNIVSINPEICRLPEIRFLAPRWWHNDVVYFIRTRVGSLDSDANVERMVEMFFSRRNYPGLGGAYWRFENYEHIVNDQGFKKAFLDRLLRSDRSPASVFRALVEEIALADGKAGSCVKFPLDVSHIPKLFEWYPECKVMHIIRDPRAMAVSKTNDPYGTAIRAGRHSQLAYWTRKSAMLFATFQYVWASRLHVSYQRLPNYRLFRYEDLLHDPEATIRELCSFLELDFSPEMLQPQKGRHEHQASSITGKKRKDFDREAAWRWKKVISNGDARLIEMLTKRSMERFAYSPAKYLATE